MMGNTYYAFTNLKDYQSWVELFGLVDEDPLYQKRILSIISGAILPLVALGFIKSLVDYIRPAIGNDANIQEAPREMDFVEVPVTDLKAEQNRVAKIVEELKEEGKLPTVNHTEDEDEPTALANSEYRLEEREHLPFIEDVFEMKGLDISPEKEAELVEHIKDSNNFTAVHQDAVKEAKKLPPTIAQANQEEILKEFEESSEIDNKNGSEKKSLI